MKKAYQTAVLEFIDVTSDVLTDSGDVLMDASVFETPQL